jgi:hypothetical protein
LVFCGREARDPKVFEGGRVRRLSTRKERALRWVEELRKEQDKTAREEARKEEVLRILGEIAESAGRERSSHVQAARPAQARGTVSRIPG